MAIDKKNNLTFKSGLKKVIFSLDFENEI